MIISPDGMSPRAKDKYDRVVKFIKEKIEPRDAELMAHAKHPDKWVVNPLIEELKVNVILFVDIM